MSSDTGQRGAGRDYPPIGKDAARLALRPHLDDYARVRQGFSWNAARALLTGLPDGGLNIAFEAVDRHADGPRGGRIALAWRGRSGARQDFTYSALRDASNRFANALGALGVARGERVFVLAGRIPELYVAVLGAFKAGAVVFGHRAQGFVGLRRLVPVQASRSADPCAGPKYSGRTFSGCAGIASCCDQRDRSHS